MFSPYHHDFILDYLFNMKIFEMIFKLVSFLMFYRLLLPCTSKLYRMSVPTLQKIRFGA